MIDHFKTMLFQFVSKNPYTVSYSGPWSLTRQIFRSEGVLGFFKGFWPTFAREVPGYFFFFGGYELSRYLLTPKGKTKDEIG